MWAAWAIGDRSVIVLCDVIIGRLFSDNFYFFAERRPSLNLQSITQRMELEDLAHTHHRTLASASHIAAMKELSPQLHKPDFDKTSYSRPKAAITEHIHLDWELDFDAKVLFGSVRLDCRTLVDGTASLLLDTRSLDISEITVKQACGNKKEVILSPSEFRLSPTHEAFGERLEIDLPAACRAADAQYSVGIRYSTSPGDGCTAAQWLPPAQTAGKKHPYFFTQCQAIHARALLPCQDTPLVKTTYSARVVVPAMLTAVMSACESGRDDNCDVGCRWV